MEPEEVIETFTNDPANDIEALRQEIKKALDEFKTNDELLPLVRASINSYINSSSDNRAFIQKVLKIIEQKYI